MAENRQIPTMILFRTIWEETGDEPVHFENLEDRRGEFKVLAEISVGLNLDVPILDLDRLIALAARLGLTNAASAHLVDRLELVVGWYLAPLQRRALGQDVKSARRLLGKVANNAARLLESLDQIDPRTAALLHFLLLLDADALVPDEPLNLLLLRQKVNEVALLAERAANDIPISTGRPSDYVRNSALVLAIQAVTEATGERVTLSRGTGSRPEPHFANAGGWLVRDLFAELGLTQESVLAQAAERIRRTGKL